MKLKFLKNCAVAGTIALLSNSGAFAQVVDHATYRDTAGIKCENKWLWSRNHNKAGFESLEFVKNHGTRARTATIDFAREKVHVAWNPQFTEINGTDTITTEFGRIATFDLKTGKYEGYVQLNENGTPITGLLTVEQIGVDDFGNIWFKRLNMGPTQEKPIKIYVVDDIKTGACHQVGQWVLPADEESKAGRVNYCDVVGDITGQEANAVMMAAVGVFGSNEVNGLYRWELKQGETEWVGGFNGYVAATVNPTETYPEGTVSWGPSSADIKIVKENERDFSGKHFYVDGFMTLPTLYNTSLEMVESFASAPELCPDLGCNGIDEFTLGEKRFIAYVEAQYDKKNGCRVNICELGEGRSFEEMKKYWSVPDAGLGQQSDGGNRIHSIATQKVIDANGKEGVYLLTYKCYNGIGLYLIAEDGFIESSSSAPSTTKATSVTLSSTALNMTPGATKQLTATVQPENATNKAVIWTSSNTSVATVNATGLVTAVANGSATITATTTDGSKLSASCLVSVTTPSTTPDYSFEMSCDDVFANTTINLPVAMNNIGDITAFQCDIYLPENVSIETNSNGRYNITLSERAGESHSVIAQKQADGAVRVIAVSLSSDKELFSGNSGTLFNIPLAIGDIEGNFSVYIKNISLSDANANEIFVKDAVLEIEVTKYRKGDANGDGRISVVDLTATVQYILGIIPANFVFSAADINNDERIAINDLVAIVNLVMSETATTSSMNAVNLPGTSLSAKVSAKNTAVATSDATISIDDFDILQGEEKVITVNLDNAMSIVGYQCDIVLPDGLEFVLNKAGRVTATLNTDRCYDHTLTTNILADGSCRMLCLSYNNTAIDGNSGAIFTFKVKAKENATIGATSISIKNAELSDANAISIFPTVNDVTVNIKENSGVDNIYGAGITVKTNGNNIIITSADENIAVNIYNANGALIYSGDDNVITIPTHGVYIVKVNNHIFKVVI